MKVAAGFEHSVQDQAKYLSTAISGDKGNLLGELSVYYYIH